MLNIAGLFCGQGSQRAGMGARLLGECSFAKKTERSLTVTGIEDKGGIAKLRELLTL